jgi:hypothetical protein
MKNKYPISMKLTLLVAIIAGFSINLNAQNAWINEFHYDNAGDDVGEFVEVVIENPGSYTLSLFSVVLYNGNGGTSYNTKTLDLFTVGSTSGNYTFYTYTYPTDGIQNGAPDGIALAYNGVLISAQFLSYEGTFTGAGGVAGGVPSANIGVLETSSTPTGQSLQLSGSGSQYSDFTWQAPATATAGNLNNGQTLTSGGIANPGNFNATAFNTAQIDLSWILNGSSDSVLIAQNITNSFGTPSGVYYVGNSIGSATVIYKGLGTSTSDMGLTEGTEYFYTAWSFTTSHQYSLGISDSATTLKSAPANYPTDFLATANGLTLTLTWNDATVGTIPDGYLVMVNDEDMFTAPVNGTPVTNDEILSDGYGVYNVAAGKEAFTFYLLDEATFYYAEIYPYTNSGANILYKTDGTAPSGNDETQSVNNSNDFASLTFGTWDTTSVASNKDWTISTGSGPFGTTGYAFMNGFGGTTTSDDWLISPALNLDMFTNDKMHFFNSWNFTGPDDELKLKYSTDYAGDPTVATWTELTFTRPSAILTWTSSGVIDLSEITGTAVYLAFHYVSGGTTGGTTRSVSVDEIEITGDGVSNLGNFNAMSVSSTEIDLAWTRNSYNDDVMVAWNSVNQFGTPSGAYAIDDNIAGGGTVLYIGQNESFNHTSLTAGTIYYYKAWSVDPSDHYSSGVLDSASTQSPEPSGHPTGLTAEANSYSQITVSWTDSDAARYLVKGSNVSAAAIVPPVDGVGQSDSLLVKNIEAGVGEAVFSGLMPNTTYFFKIFPYNGSGESANYKTDGTVPEASATTDDLNLNVIIAEIADPRDSSNAKFVEIYNPGTQVVDFSVTPIYLCRQSNGGTTWGNLQLTGTMAAGDNMVIGYLPGLNKIDSIRFSNAYGFNPDTLSSVANGNGDDGYFLFYNGNQTSGTLIDAYGEIGVDGTLEPWLYEDKKAVRKRNISEPSPVWNPSEWVILADTAFAADMTPGYHHESYNWLGAASTNWNQKGQNWDNPNRYIPDASCIITIPFDGIANFPIVTEPSACHGLEIMTGATMSVQSTGTLRIVGQ